VPGRDNGGVDTPDDEELEEPGRLDARTRELWSRPISSEQLTVELLPEPFAPWNELALFAETLDRPAVPDDTEQLRDPADARFEEESPPVRASSTAGAASARGAGRRTRAARRRAARCEAR